MNVTYPSSTFPELTDRNIQVFDYETDGFLKEVTRAHCSVHMDPKHPKSGVSYDPESVIDSLDTLGSAGILVGHNIIGYDLPMLKQVYDWEPRDNVIVLDTLVMSRLYNPDLEGGHSLSAWGEKLGNPKTNYTPPGGSWKNYEPAMLTYCEQDVAVNVDLFNQLLILLKNFSWKSIICEMDVAKLIQRQMTKGFTFNLEQGERLHAEITDKVHVIEDTVHETFKPIAKAGREVQPKTNNAGKLSPVGLNGFDLEHFCTPEYTERTEEYERFQAYRELTPQYEAWEVQGYPEGDWMYAGTTVSSITTFTGKPGVYSTKARKVRTYSSGAFSKVEFPVFSLGSRQQIAERLVRAGFKLTNFTDKGNPIIDDSTLADAVKAGIAEATPLAEYFMLTKREAMLKSWIASVVLDDNEVPRIHGYVNPLGAVTNRMTHSSPNLAQVPASYSPYGKECRSLFTVPYGYKLVGCDASGLELRCLAHYMGDQDYIDVITDPLKDIHTLNQEAAGLATRDLAKTFIYALNYGAGDAKIGSIIGGKGKEGKALKAKFLAATPALAKLKDRIASAVKTRKWLKGVDGRIIRVRSPHAALNTILQGMGAIVMKYWLIEVAKNADAEGLDWYPVANIHDEGQFEVLEAHVPRFMEICEAAFITISKDLDLACLCEGEAMVGDTWAETH